MSRRPKQINLQAGMSLIELMVALALGAFLILGVVNVLISSKDSSQVENSLARLQENGRIALDLMVADIRDALYIGCNSGGMAPTIMANTTSWTGLLGYERGTSAWSPVLPTKLVSLATAARIGSDVINLQGGVPTGSALTADIVTSSTFASVDSNPACIAKNDRVLISDCSTANLFRVTNSPLCTGAATNFTYASASNSPSSISPGYSSTGSYSLLEFFDKTWYVADTGRTRTAANIPVYALYRLTNGVTQEMIEGVEYLQILYGEELPSGNIRYVPASNATLDMTQVTAIRIGVLLQSYEPVLDAADSTQYRVLDETIDSTGTTFTHNGDLTMRRVFKTTAIMRNK